VSEILARLFASARDNRRILMSGACQRILERNSQHARIDLISSVPLGGVELVVYFPNELGLNLFQRKISIKIGLSQSDANGHRVATGFETLRDLLPKSVHDQCHSRKFEI
jgi:hypothetical protein